jgi:hypothetical protein
VRTYLSWWGRVEKLGKRQSSADMMVADRRLRIRTVLSFERSADMGVMERSLGIGHLHTHRLFHLHFVGNGP